MEPTSHARHDWPLIILFALLLLGGVFTLYQAFAQQTAANAALQNKVAHLEQALQTTQQSLNDHHADAQIDALASQLQGLNNRLTLVEKTTQAPAPIITWEDSNAGITLQHFTALQQAIAEGKPYAAPLAAVANLPQLAPVLSSLQAHAETGVTSEAALRAQLTSFLAAQPENPHPADDAKLAKLNERLQGLLTIHRTPPAPTDIYATLRAEATAEASLPLLIQSVSALDDAARAPLADWLQSAQTRQAVIDALQAALTTPKPAA